MSNSGYSAAKAALRTSLKKCGLDYIDLYLIHSPIGGPQKRADSWKAAVEGKAEGLVRSVGVSNYGVRHLQEMVDAGVELPALNQVWRSWQNRGLRANHSFNCRSTSTPS